MIRSLAVVFLGATSPAAASPAHVVLDPPSAMLTGAVCGAGANRCHVHVRATAAGEVLPFAAPVGYGPPDIQAAYDIDPSAAMRATVAIIDAYGYPNLESDLAAYRAQYGLPACTGANGCLTIVNGNGDAAPLPPPPPAGYDWTIETALDVDMISAACPSCKIAVVQTSDTNDTMFAAQPVAAKLGTVVSISWGQPQTSALNVTAYEPYFDHPGVATFVSSGDSGYNEGGAGPHYPSTSAFAIAVGGTHLEAASNARGWSETAWSSAGSSCSVTIAKPAYQQAWPCAHKAATDLSVVADITPGVAIYNAANGGWLDVGGTSAAAPLVAAMFAGSGHGAVTGADVAALAPTFHDVTSGTNGACGTALCNAGPGWDGPTGFGTPDVAALMMAPPPVDPGSGSDAGSGSAAMTSDDVTGGCAVGGRGSWGFAVLVAIGMLRRTRRWAR